MDVVVVVVAVMTSRGLAAKEAQGKHCNELAAKVSSSCRSGRR